MLFVLTLLLNGAPADDWLPMPDGRLHHRECIHKHGSAAMPIAASEPQCPYPSRPASPRPVTATRSQETRYYSDWVAYTQYTSENGVRFMSSTWQVPPAPKGRGPLGLSSVYLFNGLEDSHGERGAASMILQPVLQYVAVRARVRVRVRASIGGKPKKAVTILRTCIHVYE